MYFEKRDEHVNSLKQCYFKREIILKKVRKEYYISLYKDLN